MTRADAHNDSVRVVASELLNFSPKVLGIRVMGALGRDDYQPAGLLECPGLHPRQSTTGVVAFYVEKAIELVSLGRERLIEPGGVGFAVHRAMRDEIVVAEKKIENSVP